MDSVMYNSSIYFFFLLTVILPYLFLSIGSLVIDNSSLIHDFYADECQTTSPIHLVVDTSLPTDADAINVKV